MPTWLVSIKTAMDVVADVIVIALAMELLGNMFRPSEEELEVLGELRRLYERRRGDR